MIESVEVVIRQPGFPDRVVPLQPGCVRLGRADDNELVLPDVGVSRRHAQIMVNDTEVVIEDLGSGNGTYHFGHRISSQALRDQDEVVIDPFVLHFRIQGTGIVPVAGAATTPSEPAGARIEVVVGNGMVGNVFPVTPTGLSMGRAEDRDIVVPDPASSRHHCQIEPEGDNWILRDNGSANGVFVNAVRVRECTLSDGDLVRIGNTEMRFVNPRAQIEDFVAAAAPPPAAVAQPSSPPVRQPSMPPSAAPAKSNKTAVIAAVLGLVAVLAVAALAALFALVVIAFFFVSTTAAPAAIDPTPPTWNLEVGAPPSGSTSTLVEQGLAQSNAGEHAKALESFRAALAADPGNDTAIKFAAYSGQMLLSTHFTDVMNDAVTARMEREERRDTLLRQVTSRNVRRSARAKSELTQDFREDPKVQAEMNWGLTDKQRGETDDIDRIDRYIKVDRHAEAIRLGRRLLETSRDPERRERVNELLAGALRHQAELTAPRWRAAVMAEARGDLATADAEYKAIISSDTSNPSVQLRMERLDAK